MYMEEMKENEQNNGSEDKSSKSNEDPSMEMTSTQEKGPANETEPKSFDRKQVSKSQNTPIVSVARPSTSPVRGSVRNQSGFSFNIGSSELDGITQGSPKKLRNHEIMHSPNSVPSMNMDIKPNEQLSIKIGDERQGRYEYPFMGNQTNFIGGFGQYQH